MKTCRRCKQTKPLDEFRKAKGARDKLHSWCRLCCCAWQRIYTKTASGRESLRNSKFKKQYGITLDEYNELFTQQSGNCAICGVNQSTLARALCVDHNHKTGAVRGLLCGQCNVGLGAFKEKHDILMTAIAYLKSHQNEVA